MIPPNIKKRQGNMFSSLMENFDIAREALKVSQGSDGSAMAEHGTWSKSLQAHTTKLKAAWQGLSNTFMDSTFLKGLTDIGTGALNAVDSMFSNVGVLGSLIGGGAITGFIKNFDSIKSRGQEKLMNSISNSITDPMFGLSKEDSIREIASSNLTKSNKLLMLTQHGVSAEMAESTLKAAELSAGLDSGARSSGKLRSAFKRMGSDIKSTTVGIGKTMKAHPWMTGLAIASTIASVGVALYNNHKQKQYEKIQAELDAGAEGTKHLDELSDIYTGYLNARQRYNAGAMSNQEFNSSMDGYLKSLGAEGDAVSNLKGEYQGLDDVINDRLITNLQKSEGELQRGLSGAKDALVDAADGFAGLTGQSMEFVTDKFSRFIAESGKFQGTIFGRRAGNIPGQYDSFVFDFGPIKNVDDAIKKYNTLNSMLDELRGNIGPGEDQWTAEEMMGSEVYKGITSMLGKFESEAKVYLGYINDINKNKAMQHMVGSDSPLSEFTSQEAYERWRDEFAKSSPSGFVGSQDDIKAAIDEVVSSMPDYAKFVNGTKDYTEMFGDSASKFADAKNKMTAAMTGIAKAQSVLASQVNGKTISLEDLNSDELKDYLPALENVNGAMHLNAERVREITRAKAEEQIATNSANKAAAQNEYVKNAQQIASLEKHLNTLGKSEVNDINSTKAKIDTLKKLNDEIENTCKQYDAMNALLGELDSGYGRWLSAQGNGPDFGDMANSAASAYSHIKSVFQQGSENYGYVGTEDFAAAVDFLVPDEVQEKAKTGGRKVISDYIDGISSYFTNGGKKLNTDKFLEESTKAGLMEKNEDGGFDIIGDRSIDEFAEKLGLSKELAQAFIDELMAMGAQYEFNDDDTGLGKIAEGAKSAIEKLESENGPGIQIDFTGVEDGEEKLAAINKSIEALNNQKLNIDTKDFNAAMTFLIAQKQELEKPAIMDVDPTKIGSEHGDLGKAVELVQDFQNTSNEIEKQGALGNQGKVKEAEAHLAEVHKELQGISKESKDALGLDTTSVESVKKSIPEIDTTNLPDSEQEGPTVTVKYVPETGQLPTSFTCDDVEVTYVAETSSLPSSFPPITRIVNYVYSGSGPGAGGGGAGGGGGGGGGAIAVASGTAYASGSWGFTKGGRSMVGELGQEIVVNPRSGNWYTVGDYGAEIRNIPSGSIVFNHKQSKDLIEHGRIFSRGKAYASGTAYAGGSGYRISGGIDWVPSRPKPSLPPKNPPMIKPGELDFKQNQFDWIEILLERIEEALKKVKKAADSTFKSLNTRISLSMDQLDKIGESIEKNNAAAQKYLEQAESIGLSDEVKKKIQEGTLDFEKIKDKRLVKAIKLYQDFYDKFLDCTDAANELKESIAELHQDQFKNIENDFENQISLIENLGQQYQNNADLIKEKGHMSSEEYFSGMKLIEGSKADTLNKELKALEKRFKIAMDSGQIEKYSDAWYEFVTSINDVKNEIAKTEIETARFDKELRELKWEKFDYLQEELSSINDEADFLIDVLGRDDLHDKDGNITKNGTAVLGLHGQNYNVYMEQAKRYADEVKKIDKDIANDPANVDLIKRKKELIDLQRDSISAAEDEKEAMKDLVEEGLEKQIDSQKDAIEKQLDSIKDLVDGYKDAIDSAKSLKDYEDNVSEKADAVAKLQKQLAAYSGDNSDESVTRIQKLEAELKHAQNDLNDTEYDRFIDDQRTLLDDFYADYEENLNDQMTALDEKLDDIDIQISEIISDINSNYDEIGQTVHSAASDVGYKLSSSISDIWSKPGRIDSVVTEYGSKINTSVTSVSVAIKDLQESVIKIINAPNPEYGDGGKLNSDYVNSEIGSIGPYDVPQIVHKVTPEVPKPVEVTPPANVNNKITFGNININRVEDYKDFVKKMQESKEFEKMMQSMTLERLRNKNPYSKYSHRV